VRNDEQSAGHDTVDSSLPSPVGLIAGEGRFPFLVLEAARRAHLRTVTLGIRGAADPALAHQEGENFHWLKIGQVKKCVRLLREAGIDKAVMAGRVKHVRAFDILQPDPLMLKILSRLTSRGTHEMLRTLADVLLEEGVELIDSTLLVRESMASEGTITRRSPSAKEWESVRFGVDKARGLAALDVGQTVVVKERAVVTAEAMEGTDEAVRRARRIVDGPFVVVKVARPNQDVRFDVPVVGPGTIEAMREAEARVLALEPGRVLILDKEDVLRRADESGIAIVGFERTSASVSGSAP
jgi:DUF1009 family protein